ncbi:hypothetical protein [Clostridium oryzae]|uniref:Uncharacterized protein n=1 Tax=Clostridium oryzae TaxID=1450648 RepID=A0A1V4IQG7_9CLOT|nr:hypothetical protein [Clostridium oryzae]OPJ62271.1 hypothetical protein CLORY_18860 [Clostridium oryzae]
MKCHTCQKNFDYYAELKFCPFCGCEINIEKKVNLGNTLNMPPVTDSDIINRKKKQKASKKLNTIKSIIMNPKIGATIITALAIVILSVWAYRYYFYGAVDSDKLKGDLKGKTIVLAKHHPFLIKENYIKDMKIISSKKEKGKMAKNVLLILKLSNEQLDVEGRATLHYVYKGAHKWSLYKKIKFKTYSVLPASGMKENEVIGQMRQQTVNIDDGDISLENKYLKTIQIVRSELNQKDKKEKLKVKVVLDNGIQNSEGQLDVKAAFSNFKWKIVSVDQPSEFKSTLSNNFSYTTIINDIKETSLEGNYVYNTVFNKEPFYVPAGFDENIKVKDKTYDNEARQLKVDVERNVKVGELSVTFTGGYAYQLSFDSIDRIDDDQKAVISSVSVNKINESKLRQLIIDAELDGKRKFLWWNDTHEISEDEANTFKIEKVGYVSGSLNEQYVTGKITINNDSEPIEEKAAAKVYLKYDENNGYIWCLDKIVTEESPEYDDFQ